MSSRSQFQVKSKHMYSLTPLIAAVLPFIVWPIELVLPYPAVVEELAKAATVFFLNRHVEKFHPYTIGIVVGCMFALSESVLYLFNITAVGTLSTFLVRLALTIPLHIVTATIISQNVLKGTQRALFGILCAIAIHAFYNFILL